MERTSHSGRAAFGWTCILLFLGWQVLLVPRLAVLALHSGATIRSATYPAAVLATAETETIGLFVLGFVWLVVSVLLGTSAWLIGIGGPRR